MRVLASLLVAIGTVGILSAHSAIAAPYREQPVLNGGTITGHVHVTGEIPALPPQPVFKMQEQCGESMPDEQLLVDKNRELRNAVVSLTDITAGKPIARDHIVKIDNTKCAFVPHVVSATIGQTLEIHNTDPFLHDAHARLGSRTLFNVAVPKGRTVRKVLQDPGLIHINCNVRHTWMHAYLYVAEHPYHTVTGADGQFTIDGVPPGTYTVRVWHELLGSVDRQVTVQSAKTTTIDIDLPAVAPQAADAQ